MQRHQHLVCRQEQRLVPAGLRCAAPHWHMHHILVACTQSRIQAPARAAVRQADAAGCTSPAASGATATQGRPRYRLRAAPPPLRRPCIHRCWPTRRLRRRRLRHHRRLGCRQRQPSGRQGTRLQRLRPAVAAAQPAPPWAAEWRPHGWLLQQNDTWVGRER